MDSFMSTGVALKPARKPTPRATMENMAKNRLRVLRKVRITFLL